MDLNSNLNGYSKEKGIYFYTMPHLKKNMSVDKFIKVWEQSIVIVDEYDWILLDGSIDAIVN